MAFLPLVLVIIRVVAAVIIVKTAAITMVELAREVVVKVLEAPLHLFTFEIVFPLLIFAK